MKNNENVRDVKRIVQVETLIEINLTLGRIANLLFMASIAIIASILGAVPHVGPINLIVFLMFVIALSISIWFIERAEKQFKERIFKILSAKEVQ